MPDTPFFRLLKVPIDDKGDALAARIAELNARDHAPDAFLLDPATFRHIPGSPFAYWVSGQIISLFSDLTKLGERVDARQGLITADDFRFLRTWWEIKTEKLAYSREETHQTTWVHFAKGGAYSPFYYDVHLVVNWEQDGDQIKHFYTPGGRLASRPQNTDFYFRPGLTWPRRTNGFSVRVLPSGCIFADKGPAIFVQNDDPVELLSLLAIINSIPFEMLVRVQLARTELAQSYEVGLIKNTPIPDLNDPTTRQTLTALAREAHDLQRDRDRTNETTHAFGLPGLVAKRKAGSLIEAGRQLQAEERARQQRLAAIQARIDDIVFALYGLDEHDRALIQSEMGVSHGGSEGAEEEIKNLSDLRASVANDGAFIQPKIENSHRDTENTEEELIKLSELRASVANIKHEQEAPPEDMPLHVQNLLMWAVGVAFGRWDLRMALDPTLLPTLQGPFDPLPRCAPGALVGTDGLPPRTAADIAPESWLRTRENVSHRGTERIEEELNNLSASVANDYPLDIAWDGILVDDPTHARDIVTRVRQVLRLLWGERADAIEQEICDILGYPDLRTYFRDPRKGFFAFHIKRYSKSRRKAPIYWLLQSEKRNYAIWLYIHRLHRYSLYEAARNYADAKENLEQGRLDELKQRLDTLSGAIRRRREREIAQQKKLVAEVTAFRKTLDRIALLNLPPDLNDGVVISIAPLWELVPWKEAKRFWDKLMAGEYDWSTMSRLMREKGLIS